MSAELTRRSALVVSLAMLGAFGAQSIARAKPDLTAALAALEKKNGGRLGVAILDTATGTRIVHRADERFAMCSTFKFLAAAHILARVDKGEERLDRRITYAAADLMPHSPVTKDHVAGGMTMAEFCEAAVTQSDNTAANLMLASSGGPAGFTAYARSLGDGLTRLDRIEPELNDSKPGDQRDTTTPAAMLEDLRKLVLGDALKPSSSDLLTDWIVANKTGDKRLRAGLPKGWRVGDKTGTSGQGNFNDLAVAWPPGRAPLIIAVYYAEATLPDEQANAVIAEVGAIAAKLAES